MPNQEQDAAFQGAAATAYIIDGSSVAKNHLVNRSCAKMTPVQFDARGILGFHQLLQEQLLYAPVHKARPKSAAVTAAAWKAYASPSLKGQIRVPPPPSPAHRRTRQNQGPEPLSSRTPSVGVLGGGFTYPCAGTRIQSTPQVPTVAFPTRSTRHMLQLHVGEPVSAVPGLTQAAGSRALDLISGTMAQHPDDLQEYRHSPTRPTDPAAQRVWSQLVSRAAASPGSKPSRPQSACPAIQPPPQQPAYSRGRPRPVSASGRFSSLKVSTVHHLGARYVPPAVPGHREPEQEHVVPQAGDARWMYSRVGSTALARLQTSIKMPMSMAQHTGSPGRPVSPTHLSITTLAAGVLMGTPELDVPASLDLSRAVAPADDTATQDTRLLQMGQPMDASDGKEETGLWLEPAADSADKAEPFWCTELDEAHPAPLPVYTTATEQQDVPTAASDTSGTAQQTGVTEPEWEQELGHLGRPDAAAQLDEEVADQPQEEPLSPSSQSISEQVARQTTAGRRPGSSVGRPASARPWSGASSPSVVTTGSQDPRMMYAIEEGSGDDEDMMV